MGKEKNKMEQRILKTNELIYRSHKFIDMEIAERICIGIRKYGQLKPVLVRKKGEKYEVVDGGIYLLCLEKEGIIDILCFDLGELNDKEFYELKLSINNLIFEVDNLALAGIIDVLIQNKNDARVLSNKININEEDIMRYKGLLTVNWQELSKQWKEEQLLRKTQINLF